MPQFVDLHCHMLSYTDDGAASDEEMYAMLNVSYADGARHICLTPHFNTYVWPGTPETAAVAFEKLTAYAKRYPDLRLWRANELFYQQDAPAEIAAGHCLTLGGGRFILVDFSADVSYFDLTHALQNLQNHGYLPVLAHVERYTCLCSHPERAEALTREHGVPLQVNASSLFGAWGFSARCAAARIIRRHLCSVVASDAHGVTRRRPGLSRAYACVRRYCGEAEAEALFYENPLAMLENRFPL